MCNQTNLVGCKERYVQKLVEKHGRITVQGREKLGKLLFILKIYIRTMNKSHKIISMMRLGCEVVNSISVMTDEINV